MTTRYTRSHHPSYSQRHSVVANPIAYYTRKSAWSEQDYVALRSYIKKASPEKIKPVAKSKLIMFADKVKKVLRDISENPGVVAMKVLIPIIAAGVITVKVMQMYFENVMLREELRARDAADQDITNLSKIMAIAKTGLGNVSELRKLVDSLGKDKTSLWMTLHNISLKVELLSKSMDELGEHTIHELDKRTGTSWSDML